MESSSIIHERAFAELRLHSRLVEDDARVPAHRHRNVARFVIEHDFVVVDRRRNAAICLAIVATGTAPHGEIICHPDCHPIP
jgi:hypothetical protein